MITKTNNKLIAFILITAPTAFAGPMVGGGPNPNSATMIIKEFVSDSGMIVSKCTINSFPNQVSLIHSDGSFESTPSPIQKLALDKKIYSATQEVEYRLSNTPRSPYLIIYARNLNEQVTLYDSRPTVLSIRQGSASHFLMNTVEELCAGLH